MVKLLDKVKKTINETTAKAQLLAKATKLKQDSTLEDLINFLEDAAPLLLKAEGVELAVHRNQKTEDGKQWDAIILIKQHGDVQTC